MQVAGLPALQSGEPGQVPEGSSPQPASASAGGSGSPLILFTDELSSTCPQNGRPAGTSAAWWGKEARRPGHCGTRSRAKKRLHHAYLFAGTRGVGKTTLARILAKCLNCENRPSRRSPAASARRAWKSTPGRFVDLLEVDAAHQYSGRRNAPNCSRTAQYVPSRGRYKVVRDRRSAHAGRTVGVSTPCWKDLGRAARAPEIHPGHDPIRRRSR